MQKILYVEDDPDTRGLLQGILTDEGYAVTAVDSAESALGALGSQTFDVVLTDYVLPGQNGAWLLAEATRRGYLDRPAIVLSGEQAPAGIDGHHFLRKPVDLDLLLRTIAETVPLRRETRQLRSGPAAVVIDLYVTGRSHQSMKALRKLRQAIDRFGPHRVALRVLDVEHAADDPEVAHGLEADGIIVTPTLVRRVPAPKLWIAGDLTRKGAIDEVLNALREVDHVAPRSQAGEC